MAKLSALLIAAHRGPTLAMVSLSTAFAVLVGAPAILSALAVLAGQLSVGWQNDLLDRQRDQHVGRIAKPLVNGSLTTRELRWVWPIAVAGVVLLSFPAFGVKGGLAHLVAVASAWTYNLYFKRTLFSFLPYVVSFALLPSAILWGAQRDVTPVVLGLGAVAGVIIHVVNVWPDIDEDLATGVRGLPQRLVAFARDSSTTHDRRLSSRFAQWLRRRT